MNLIKGIIIVDIGVICLSVFLKFAYGSPLSMGDILKVWLALHGLFLCVAAIFIMGAFLVMKSIELMRE